MRYASTFKVMLILAIVLIPFIVATPVRAIKYGGLIITNYTIPSFYAETGVPFSLRASFYVIGGSPPFKVYTVINGYTVGSPIVAKTRSIKLNIYMTGVFKPFNYTYYFLVVSSSGNAIATPKSWFVVVPHVKVSYSISMPAVVESGEEVKANAVAFYGKPPYFFKWCVNGQVVSNTKNATIEIPDTKTVNISVTVTDSLGASYTSSKVFAVYPGVRATVPITYYTKPGGMVDFAVNISGGTPPYTYSIYLNGKKVSLPIHAPTKPGLYKYLFTVKDKYNSTFSEYIDVVVVGKPVINIVTLATGNTNPFFRNNFIELYMDVNGGLSPYHYYWFVNGKNVSSNNMLRKSLFAGKNVIVAEVVDSVGNIAYKKVVIDVSLNYHMLAFVSAVVIIVAVIIYITSKRRLTVSSY